MNPQICTFFLVITSVFNSVCQISFDFEDPDFDIGETWSGDLDNFVIRDGRLYLNDQASGKSIIHTTYSLDSTLELSILVGLDFAPSAQNRLIINLWKRSIEDVLSDALFLVIGESGNDDAIELYQSVNGEEILLGRGTNGSLSKAEVLTRIKVEIAGQMLSLSADYNGEFLTRQEIRSEFDGEISGEGHFMINCMYTATRADRFFFDDIYIGDIRIDSLPPKVIEANFEPHLITIIVDEILLPEQVVSDLFHVLPLDALPDSVSYDPIGNSVSLSFSNPLPEQTELSLEINDLTDLSGNSLDTIIEFFMASSPGSGELLINEVLFNPRADGVDFIELYNPTSTWLSLDQLKVINDDNGDSFTFSEGGLIGPLEFAVLTSDSRRIISDYSAHDERVMYNVDLPRLNNDKGNITLIIDESQIIDELDYDEDFHLSILDIIDGVSLERIDINSPTNESSNWTSASSAIGFATPGLVNSAISDKFSELKIEMSSKIISPNGDQFDDVLLINYALDKSDYLSTVTIYSDRGEQVAMIANNQISGSQGIWQWDGKREDNQEVVNSGIYVVLIELQSLSGNRERIKRTIVVTDFID